MNSQCSVPWPGIVISAALVAVVLAAPEAPGFPISPVTLWELTAEADLIVWAEVEKAGILPDHDPEVDDWYSREARLRVLETWKGGHRERVTVRYEATMICPAPARYVEGRQVLAFLQRGPGGSWSTVGLSYGSLYPDDDEVADYRHMVRWALRLQRGARPARADEEIDWLVEAATRPGTRWHGLYELHPVADRVHAAYDRSLRPAAARRLPRRHLEKIAGGFVSSPPTDRALPMTLAVLAHWESEEVDRAAISVVEALVAEERSPYWLRETLGLLWLRLGDPDPAVRLAALGDVYGPIDPERLREVWERSRAELAIPALDPMKLPEDVVWGVGSSTPD